MYTIGDKVTKIFIFPYLFFIIIFYLCHPFRILLCIKAGDHKL